jgi:murein DD-endopeptidase MepM/ murein hydrolase activator NlpD
MLIRGGRVTLGLLLGSLLAGCGGGGGETKSAGEVTSPVSGEARDVATNEGLSALIVSPVEPAIPFRGSGGTYLVSYELRVFNTTPLTLAPARVSVSTPSGAVIEKLDRRQVTAALALPGARSGVRELHEGQLATLYLTLHFSDRSKIPDRLVHRITGVDWEQIDATGRFVKRGGNPADSADYTIYGAPVIAAADARIVHVVDGLPAQRPGTLPEGLLAGETDGNSIVAKLDDGLYMLYGHLQAGSIKVRDGDEVKRGDPLGLVGNSGNSSAPHLHFHVMDGPSPLTSEGVPYVIDTFATEGRLRSTAVFDKYENTTTPFEIVPFPGSGPNRAELPLDLTVVDFA